MTKDEASRLLGREHYKATRYISRTAALLKLTGTSPRARIKAHNLVAREKYRDALTLAIEALRNVER